MVYLFFFFFSSRRRHTRCGRDWSSDVCSSDLLQSQGGAGFVNPDDNLLVPLDTMAGRVTSADPDVSQIRVAAAPDAVSTFGNSVIAALRDSHGLASDQDNDFLVINPNSLIQAQQTSSDNFTRLITAIAAISLVVGGIGIANVM